MKKILFGVVSILMFIPVLNAECLDPDILKWAKKVEIAYETSEKIPNAEYLYYLYLNPSRDDVEISSTNDLYSGTTKGAMQENNKYGIASYIHFEEKNYTFIVSMKKDAKVCAGEQIVKLKKKVPPYNSYSSSQYCYDYPEAELCQTMSDTNDLSQDEFVEKIEKYIDDKIIKDNPKEKSLIFRIIFDYLIWIIIPALIIGLVYYFRIKKVRRIKDEK